MVILFRPEEWLSTAVVDLVATGGGGKSPPVLGNRGFEGNRWSMPGPRSGTRFPLWD